MSERRPRLKIGSGLSDDKQVNYADFAHQSYENNPAKEVDPDYMLIHQSPDYVTYISLPREEIVFAIRGTSKVKDLITDAAILKGEEKNTTEYRQLKVALKQVIDEFDGKFRIILVGHSKGGRLALDLLSDYPNDVTKVYTFSPATAPVHVFRRYFTSRGRKLHRLLKENNERVAGDPISVLSTGHTKTIKKTKGKNSHGLNNWYNKRSSSRSGPRP